MSSLLLDTHILLWWHGDSDRLTRPHARLLADAEKSGQPLGISAITLWELAKMTQHGRLETKEPLDVWLEELARHASLAVFPITSRIAAESVQLGPDFHKDPADQIIVATARCHGLRLVTADQRIRKWGKVLLG